MNNFVYCNPVKIVFGKGSIAELKELLPANKKIMMIYGGGSIKANGVYDQVLDAAGGRKITEFAGIEANPLYETCMKAVEIIKRENITFLLAAGGGSVIDATKFIAAASLYAGSDPWDILKTGGQCLKSALPFGTVLTLAATGSEMNPNSVISRAKTQEKLAFASPAVYPQFSILDPETLYSLPGRQIANGIVDTFVHVMEQYMTYDNNAPLQDRQAEAVISTLLELSPHVFEEPEDYDLKANLMWCSTQALNGLIACGQPQDWSTHMIGHELTAFYGLDHAQSLAVVLPSLWRCRKEFKKQKLLRYAKRIFNIDTGCPGRDVDEAINKTEEFFHSVKVPTKLSDYGVDAKEAAEKVRDRFNARKVAHGERAEITGDVAYEILAGCK
ncbi:MAG: iron-containing alcohol dehydrogenase [Victivallaceae bacterium]|nr:iron-containing alcohol dehydrogenase [Victivallaceae bacterium]